MPSIVKSVVFGSELGADDHTVLFSKTDDIVELKNTVVDVCKCTNGTCAIELQLNGEEGPSAPESREDLLNE